MEESTNIAKKFKPSLPESSTAWASIKPATNEDCFINQYISKVAGFKGVVKQRYSDFIVHEMDREGNIVQLTSYDLPDEPASNVSPVDDSSKEKMDFLKKHLSEEQIKALESIEPGDKNSETVNIPVDDLDKDARRLIHNTISSVFPHLFTVTKEVKDESTGKVVKMIAAGTTNHWKGKANNYWSTAPGKFVHFTVYQENHGTFSVLNKLAHKLHLPIRSFSYAGTKDKRSVSTQRMCIYKGRPDHLLHFNNLFKDPGPQIAIGNLSFAQEPLRLGQLKGNQFTIVYREVEIASKSDIDVALDGISTNGFINYFGTQRFGTGTFRSDQIGHLVFKKEWKKVVLAIMSPKARDIVPRSQFKKSFNTLMQEFQNKPDEAGKIMQQFSWKNSNEGIILNELAQYPNNYKNAFLRLPRNSRTMYLHAYQSKIFNRIVSYRIEKYGSQILIGDLVMTSDQTDSLIDDETVTEEVNIENSQSEEILTQDEAAETPDINSNVTFVTEGNIKNFTIFDVVIPLLGSKTLLPKNELGEKMLDFLKEDDLSLEDINESLSGFSFYGAYRKLLVKPYKLHWKTEEYVDGKKRLVSTDLDILGSKNKLKVTDDEEKAIDLQSTTPEDKKTALIVTVQLPSSSYATVFSRELLKEHLVTMS